MHRSKKSRTITRLSALMVMITLLSVTASFQLGAEPTRDYPSKTNLAKLVPYHPVAGGDSDLTGEACLSMIFDRWGPYIQQQNIRNVTKGRLESGTATVGELTRAAHFSDQSFYTVNQRGYAERAHGYGAYSYDWTDSEQNPSPRFESRFQDLYNSISRGHVIMVYMYLDIPPEVTTPQPPDVPDPNNPQVPDPPEPQITPEDLAALEKVWRLVVGYDTQTKQLILHDPLPSGVGIRGGKEVRLNRDDFDRLWNVYQREGGVLSTHRYGVSAAPWNIMELDYTQMVEAGTTFEISANISYNAPTGMDGALVEDAQAFLDIPEDYSMEGTAQSQSLNINGPGTFSEVVWQVRSPDKSYAGQDQRFTLNTSGIVTVSDPAHRDRIGGTINFDIEAYGFLNHPPSISAAMIDPPYVPDDGSVQPLITCIPIDEDGNLIQVTVDLSSVGGSSIQRMYDNGNNGDKVEDDGIYSYMIRSEMPTGEWTFQITAKDSKGGYAYSNVSIKVDPISEFTQAPDIEDSGVTPKGVPNDGFTTGTVWAIVRDPEDDVERVTADLSPIGGDDDQKLYDNGNNGDLFTNDDNYSFMFTVDPLTQLGSYQIEITASDATGHESLDRVWIDVILPPVPPQITAASVIPEEVPNDGETIVTLTAIVEDGNEDVDEVWVDLAPLKGMSTTMMRDDGVAPDARKDDDMWTVEFTVPESVSSGLKGNIEITARDRTNLEGTGQFSIRVLQANSDPSIIDFKVSDQTVRPGDETIVSANVTDPDNDPLEVLLILTELNMNNVQMSDDGVAPDEVEDDQTFTAIVKIPESAPPGDYNVTIRVSDGRGGEYESLFVLNVTAEDEGPKEVGLNTYIYIGIPVGLGLILIILILLYMFRRSAGQQEAPVRRPMPPNLQRAPPMTRAMR
ncbi:MAG: choice-of-anchor X domain-containing protein [Thermoplasmatota archaeon]